MNVFSNVKAVKRNAFLTILLLTVGFQFSFAQEVDEEVKNSYFFTCNTLRFSCEMGVNKSQFYAINGMDLPQSDINRIPKFNLDYRLSLGNHFGVTIGGGAGVLPIRFRLPENAGGFGVSTVGPSLFGNTKIGLDYQGNITSKYIFRSSLGMGLYILDKASATISFSNVNGTGFFLQKNNNPGVNPYAFFKIGVDRKLKNYNVLGFSLSYEHFSQNIYTGTYIINNGLSEGFLENKGHNLTIGLSYGFTGVKRKLKMIDLSVNKGFSLKDSRKEIRSNNRYINPNSVFVSIKTGIFFGRNDIEGDFLETTSFPSVIHSLNGEIGYGNNYFFQGRLSIKEYYTSVKVKGAFSWGISNDFISPAFSLGIGKRLIGKSNINYLNASIGVTLNNNLSGKGMVRRSNFSIGNANSQGVLELEGESKKVFFPSVYMNLSKDFRLTNSLYLAIDYRAHLGTFIAYENKVDFYSGPNLTTVQKGIIKFNGTGQIFEFGFKYKFVPKRYLEP